MLQYINRCVILWSMNIRNLLNKKIVYQSTISGLGTSCLSEGLVTDIRGDIVKIGNDWYEIKDVIVREVISNNINESGNGGETLING